VSHRDYAVDKACLALRRMLDAEHEPTPQLLRALL
jgi:hypothetical protein